VIPDDIAAEWKKIGARGAEARKAWEERLAASDKRAAFEAALKGETPAGVAEAMAAHKEKVAAEQKTDAIRKWSGAALEVLTGLIPELVGGSADLTGSNNTRTGHTKPMTPETPKGRYIHYGVREHAM